MIKALLATTSTSPALPSTTLTSITQSMQLATQFLSAVTACTGPCLRCAISCINNNEQQEGTLSSLTVLLFTCSAAQTGMGYRVANTTGVAKGNEPETLYMVTSGQYVNDGCCFEYVLAA